MTEPVMFRGELRSARGGGHTIDVDAALASSIGVKHMSRVMGTLNGRPYRSNVAKMGGTLVLGVHKANVEALGLAIGDDVEVTMAPDTEPRGDDVAPELLAEALRRDRDAAATWERLAPSHRREYVGYIREARKEETRVRRVRRTIEELAGRNPKAR
jgi:antitoxin component of MazEF toxin-antitoxin module